MNILLDTDNRLLVTGASTVNLNTGVETYLNGSATVRCTVLDHVTQVAVAGETWPVSLTYITGSDGDFHAPLRDTLTLTEFQAVDVQLVIDNGADQKRTIVLPCLAAVDRGT